MTVRAQILEATLDSLPEGLAVLGEHGEVMFWNRAAEAISGHAAIELLGGVLPESLKALLHEGGSNIGPGLDLHRGIIAHTQHKLGHQISAMARTLVLRDGLGSRVGMAVLFHPTDCLDALPRGDCGENERLETSQTDLMERLETLFDDFSAGGPPFGVLWITVDQAAGLRRTHGAGACEAMLEKVGGALKPGLRPAEYLGRWGQDEFLVISHERTPGLLAAHAQTLAGLARTADFRWWGDRVSLTVSVGAAQANNLDTLVDLLERARASMIVSFHAGGNRITSAPGRITCLPS